MEFSVYVVTNGDAIRNITTNETEAGELCRWANEYEGGGYHVERADYDLSPNFRVRLLCDEAQPTPSTNR